MLLLFLMLGAAGVAIAMGSSSSSSSPAKPVDTAQWKRDDGSPGRDPIAFYEAMYAPPHVFSPRGLPIVRRYDVRRLDVVSPAGVIEKGGPETTDAFIRYEIDSETGAEDGSSKKYLSIRHYATRGKGGTPILTDDPQSTYTPVLSHDFLLEEEGPEDAWSVIVKAFAPLVSAATFAASFIPGVGTGVAAALATGFALAQGQTLTAALVAGARAAVPGAPATTAAFDTAYGLAQGNSISTAALAAARKLAVDELGELGGKAFDIATAVAHGQSIQEAAFQAALAYIPDDNLKEFADRVAHGQNVVEAAKAVGGEAARKVAQETLDRYVPLPVDPTLIDERATIPRYAGAILAGVRDASPHLDVRITVPR